MRLPWSGDHADEPVAGGPSGSFRAHRPPVYGPNAPIADLAAAFQDAVIEPLAVKTAQAAVEHEARTVVLAGGVAANTRLRERLQLEVAARSGPGVDVAFPRLVYCTDNASMVAGAAAWVIRRGDLAGWEADVFPRLSLVER
jgi:N6-L-threonylcarbamoyladenine synthase